MTEVDISQHRRPMEVLAEVLVEAGISEANAGAVASTLLTALRETGHSVYLADGHEAER